MDSAEAGRQLLECTEHCLHAGMTKAKASSSELPTAGRKDSAEVKQAFKGAMDERNGKRKEGELSKRNSVGLPVPAGGPCTLSQGSGTLLKLPLLATCIL